MSDAKVNLLIDGQEQLRLAVESLGRRLGFLERTVYTLIGGITVIAFLVSTGHLQLGS
jgi:hypothetical protein